MEPSILEAPTGPAKPPKWWVLVIAAAGAVGSIGAVAGAGKGTYDITPFSVRLEAVPAPLGETVLQVQPVEELGVQVPLRAEAGTHAGPLVAKATIVGTSASAVQSDRAVLQNPEDLATFLGEEGEDAIRAFAIRVGVVGITGGAAAGLLLSFGRWRRVAGGAVAGMLTVAIIGLTMQQTYDASEFSKTEFVVQPGAGPQLPDGLPSLPG